MNNEERKMAEFIRNMRLLGADASDNPDEQIQAGIRKMIESMNTMAREISDILLKAKAKKGGDTQ